MQRQYAPTQEPWNRPAPAPRFTEDEITAFIEEVAAARDRETFNRLTARFDAQFIAKFKARFPGQTGKFPFGSAGKPYTYGAGTTVGPLPGLSQGAAIPPQTAYPMPQTYGYDRPYSAAAAPSTYAYPPSDQFYAGAPYQARTPSPSHMPMTSQRFDQSTYGAAMYDRPADFRPPAPPSYPTYIPEPPPAAQSNRYPDPAYGRQPSPSKPTSFSDYAELRKMKEEMLARFQVSSAGQRPPRV